MIKNLKKYLSVLLCFALVLSTFAVPSVTNTVYAEASKVAAPTTGTYLAKADFTSDSFNDTYGLATDSQIAKKVYFGTSDTDLEWRMAGVEAVTGSDISATTLVLFSSKALSGKVAYNTPSDLANYASSYIHNTVLNNLLSSRFSPSEQEAIVPVTLGYKGWTDTYNLLDDGPGTYTDMKVTDCKLYLPDGEYSEGNETIIKVGQSNFEVKKNYWCSGAIWLRSAYDDSYVQALIANSGQVNYDYVDIDDIASPVSALNMNLTSVIFSSAAPAASSTDADLTSGITMTLRFNSAQTVTGSDCKDRIQSSAVAYKDKVKIENPTNTEFLYVQWNDGTKDRVKSIVLDSQNEIKASDICTDSNFELNDSCKIWLEKKVDNITYAKNVEFSNKQKTALTVTSSSLKVAEGETVKITVAASGASYAGIKAVLSYNDTLFEKVTVTDLAGATGNIEVSGSDITYNKIANSTNNNEDNGLVAIGDLFEVTFKAKENVTVNSSGAFEVFGEYTDSRDNVATKDAEKITEKSISVDILKVFKDANKPVAASPTTVLFDGKNKALYTTPSEIVTNSTIIYSYTKDNKTVTSTTIPQVTEIGTYTDVKYTISANGYKTFGSEPTTFTIKGPEYEVELIDNYVAGKALILVFTNADLDGQNVNVKYDAKKMYKLENSGYAVSGTNTTYTNVYGIIEKNSSEINLTRDGVKSKINFAGGSTNTSIDCINCDVNGTNKVDISDAVAAMGVYNVYDKYFTGEDVWNKIILKSDVNHDKVVDTGDVIKILLAN